MNFNKQEITSTQKYWKQIIVLTFIFGYVYYGGQKERERERESLVCNYFGVGINSP